jgi:hypothetical protein
VVDGRHHPAFETNRKRSSDMATDKEQAVIEAAREYAANMRGNDGCYIFSDALTKAIDALDAPEDPHPLPWELVPTNAVRDFNCRLVPLYNNRQRIVNAVNFEPEGSAAVALLAQIREVTERWRQSKDRFASEPNAMREISCLMDVYDRERGD